MSTPVFNNGLFLRDTSYKASSHVDSYHLASMLNDRDWETHCNGFLIDIIY